MLVIQDLKIVGRYAKIVPVDTSVFSEREQELYEKLTFLGSACFEVRKRKIFSTLFAYKNNEAIACNGYKITLFAIDKIEDEPAGIEKGSRVIRDDLLHLPVLYVSQQGEYHLKTILRDRCRARSAEISEHVENRRAKIRNIEETKAITLKRRPTPERDELIQQLNSNRRDQSIMNERDLEVQRILKVLLRRF